MEEKKLRVYWRKFDDDGNEFERGSDNRAYITYGRALNRGYDLFGSNRKTGGFEWKICWRDPWEKYTRELTCDTCGKVYTADEFTYSNGAFPDTDVFTFRFHEFDNKYSYRRVCPECARKIYGFICGLREGK